MKSMILTLVASAFGVGVGRAASLPGSEPAGWNMVRRDAARTGYQRKGIGLPLSLTWRVPTGIQRGTLLATAEVVCVTSTDPQASTVLYSNCGKELCRLKGMSARYLQGGRLLMLRMDSDPTELVCYDWRSHTALWRRSDGAVPILVLNRSAYCFVRDRDSWGAEVLSLRDGQTLRKSSALSCEATDGSLLFGGDGHWMHVTDAATLTPRWGYWDAGGDPIVSDGIVVGHGLGPWASAVRVADRKLLWTRRVLRDSIHVLGRTSKGRPVVVEAFGAPVSVGGIDLATGRLLWRYAVWCGEVASAAGACVFLPGYHLHEPGSTMAVGGFYCFGSDNGKVLWKYERPGLAGRAMIVCGNAVYGLASDGSLLRFAPHRRR